MTEVHIDQRGPDSGSTVGVGVVVGIMLAILAVVLVMVLLWNPFGGRGMAPAPSTTQQQPDINVKVEVPEVKVQVPDIKVEVPAAK